MKQSLHFFVMLTCITTINAMDKMNTSNKDTQGLKILDKEKLILVLTHSTEKQTTCLQELKFIQLESQLNLKSLKNMFEQVNIYIQNLEKIRTEFTKNIQIAECMNENLQKKLEWMEECLLDNQTRILQLEEMFIEQEERDIKSALPHEQ